MVGVPTNIVKHYCLGKFVKGLRDMEGKGEVVIADDTHPQDKGFSKNRGNDDILDKDKYPSMLRDLDVGKVVDVTETKESPDKPRILQRLVNTRNVLRQEFLKSDCSHLLFLDSDIIAPVQTIPQMVYDNKDIITGVYWQRDKDGQARPVVYKYLGEEDYEVGVSNLGYPLTWNDLIPSRVVGDKSGDVRINALGLGCCMVSRKVMEDTRWTFRFDESRRTTEDMWWSIDIKNLGYTICCDTGLLCQHYPKAWEGAI